MTAINREGVDTAYRVVVSGDEGEEQIFDCKLKAGEKWRQVVVVGHDREKQNAKASVFLYKQGVAEPYRVLYLWATVVSPD